MDFPFRCQLSNILLLPFFFLCCKNNVVEIPNQFETINTYNLTVTAIQYDEFQRVVPFTGTASLTLTTMDRVYQGTIIDGDTAFTFRTVPLQQCILRGEKNGFYPYENGEVISTAKFYPLPTPDMRIDSIQITGEYISVFNDEIRFKAVAHQKIPGDGVIYCIFLFGLDSTVSQKPGTYFSSTGGVGNSSNYFYGSFEKKIYQYPPGTTVYITARLLTGATEFFYDNSSKINILTNIEENSKAIASFTY